MWSLRLRQLIAGPVIFSLALFWLEVAVADVHDEVNPQTTLSPPGTLPVSPNATLSPESHQHSAPTDDGHPTHVCHCSHAHSTGWVSPSLEVAQSPSHKVPVRLLALAHIPTPELQPQDRPPIA